MRDGVIKFHCDLNPADPPGLHTIQDLNETRSKLHALKLIGVTDDGIGYGNVSKRTRGNEFVITASATGHIPVLNAHHFVTVDEVDLGQNRLRCRGELAASSESLTHAAIYLSNPHIKYVLHIHHLGLWKTSLDQYPTTDTDIPYGTLQMAQALAELSKQAPGGKPGIVVMGGHREGLIAFGSDLRETQEAILSLHRSWMALTSR